MGVATRSSSRQSCLGIRQSAGSAAANAAANSDRRPVGKRVVGAAGRASRSRARNNRVSGSGHSRWPTVHAAAQACGSTAARGPLRSCRRRPPGRPRKAQWPPGINPRSWPGLARQHASVSPISPLSPVPAPVDRRSSCAEEAIGRRALGRPTRARSSGPHCCLNAPVDQPGEPGPVPTGTGPAQMGSSAAWSHRHPCRVCRGKKRGRWAQTMRACRLQPLPPISDPAAFCERVLYPAHFAAGGCSSSASL